jgi:HTH-type transcriptional regulator, global nitrogen regulator NrpRI
MSFDTRDAERKVVAILKVLSSIHEPTGSRIISQRLKEHGINLSERAVRYHLSLTDKRGLTDFVGNIDGRIITEKGQAEIKKALVKDKMGFANTRIEDLAFRTDFDYVNRTGVIPVNISFFYRDDFAEALQVMQPVFEEGLCASQLVSVVDSGQRIGEVIVPEDKIGLVTICSIVINGTLLKAGIPMDSRFGGILQMIDRNPKRFTEIIHYNGCSLDPSEIFIKAKMTSVAEVANNGSGEVLANFREIPAICLPLAEKVLDALAKAGLGQVITRGVPSEPVCEITVESNKVGLILLGGLNPVAAAVEAGFEVEYQSMATVMDYDNLVNFKEILKKQTKSFSAS